MESQTAQQVAEQLRDWGDATFAFEVLGHHAVGAELRVYFVARPSDDGIKRLYLLSYLTDASDVHEQAGDLATQMEEAVYDPDAVVAIAW